MSNKAKDTYNVFIKGEILDLVIPNEHAIENDGWYNWFNDEDVTENTGHGVFPNTREMQFERLERLMKEPRNDITLLLRPKGVKAVVGVASLSSIDHQRKCAEFSMVIGSHTHSKNIMFIGLEAKARLTSHGFEKLGLHRIYTGQPLALEYWQRFQILFGFKPEGIQRKAFRKGLNVQDTVMTACLLEDYLKIKEARDGQFWPGKRLVLDMIRTIPKRSLIEEMSENINHMVNEYMESIRMY